MADQNSAGNKKIKRHYLGRMSQIGIYFGKFFRMFIYQNDWKVLPISAIIAGLVGMVIKGSFNITREGTLMGALAISCICLWNGCFNSIQVICRERGIVKREHHSGMHVSAYTAAHILFQSLICLLQCVITIVVLKFMGVHFPSEGTVIGIYFVEMFVTIFLITFSADMMSLFLSSIVHTTTAAMTLMPFILIFQLIFSGGILAIPKSLRPVCDYSISSYGIRCVAAENGYNEQPVITGWNTVYNMRNTEIGGSATVDEVLAFLHRTDNEMTANLNAKEVIGEVTVGDVLDFVIENPAYEEIKDEKLEVRLKVNDLLNMVGLQKAKDLICERTSVAGKNPDYERTTENILFCWVRLLLFSAAFAGMTVGSLKFIDRDKR